MKTSLLITVLVGVLLAMIASRAQETAKAPDYTASSSLPFATMKPWGPMSLTIPAGKSHITIKPDGAVVLGDGVSLDEATRQFWDKVGVQFGHFHDAVIAGYEARKREEDQAREVTKWLLMETDKGKYELGLRSDGVVVWRETK